MIHFFTVNTVTEIICFLTGLICLIKDRDPVWKRFILYLFIVCITELSGIYIRRTMHVSNVWVYNIFLVIECFCISLFFHHLYSNYINVSKWLIAWLAIFMVIYTVEAIDSHFQRFNNKTATLMAVVFVLASLYYFYLMLKDSRYQSLGAYAPFWWISGVLLFYFGGVIFNILFQYIADSSTFPYSMRYIIFNILNIFLYTSWSYAFICRYRQRILSP
nr:hypothetical protein [uncultured Chitinophaga sp.]